MSGLDVDTDAPAVACRGRCARCGVAADVTVDAWERAEVFNRVLHRRGEPLISTDEMALCEPCALAARAELSDQAVQAYTDARRERQYTLGLEQEDDGDVQG